ncbi:PTS fructose transporter subunit IIC [Tetragenococcus koreensis]|uniref:PTS system, fructose/mannitol specific EIIC component n=1 Tax=Tetragenococcus koreensis TaxID=290335 RepID=A0AAN4UCW9_9ENTE|nr:PTS fructose transporter subunit IIC [Tetragenococcus koreensis]AYW46583.1 PTS fructose transporter subunit IIC [Tetragenococcus koreensis]MCF1617894.1 PTS fructose transporter subunit IIC [Tetragenococcus koreensis]MCF1622687.1 PTS fructose transporter subunit IIC [Tetragenococcus koreensis]MCF1627208.1 PTS fructose transporter subunit IIC [Tetragenococcus koreensis]MCF1632666.1 PTS fructose transporter subunit IIC [Tetragenococcus koreensis]
MKKLFSELKGHLMSGISYILPLIIGASLVVAIAKVIGFAMGATTLDPYEDGQGFMHALYLVEQVGWTGIGLINTVLAGFIAYSVGDKAAIGAGFIGGAVATETNAGFLGALIAGFLAGYLVKWAKDRIKLPESFSSVMPLVILPLIATLSVAIVMGAILVGPLSWINESLINWIKHMIENDVNQVVLAMIMGGMIGVDLGGPVNKASWMAGNVLLAEGIYLPAIIVNVANCALPLGYALATVFHKNRFNNELKDAGKNNFVMGFIGITEGAIPFTLISPLKLVLVNVIGAGLSSAVGVFLGMYAKMPPVGGIYGFFSVGSGWAYLLGILLGATFIGTVAPLLVNFNKGDDLEVEDVDVDSIDISFEN